MYKKNFDLKASCTFLYNYRNIFHLLYGQCLYIITKINFKNFFDYTYNYYVHNNVNLTLSENLFSWHNILNKYGMTKYNNFTIIIIIFRIISQYKLFLYMYLI